MARHKPTGKKARLATKGRQTRWAPFWIIPKMFGGMRKIHPSRFTTRKRHWRRTKTKE